MSGSFFGKILYFLSRSIKVPTPFGFPIEFTSAFNFFFIFLLTLVWIFEGFSEASIVFFGFFCCLFLCNPS
jgi:hypothetical protein